MKEARHDPEPELQKLDSCDAADPLQSHTSRSGEQNSHREYEDRMKEAWGDAGPEPEELDTSCDAAGLRSHTSKPGIEQISHVVRTCRHASVGTSGVLRSTRIQEFACCKCEGKKCGKPYRWCECEGLLCTACYKGCQHSSCR